MSGAVQDGGQGGQQQQQQAVTDWVASLSPDHRTLVETKGYKTPADVVAAYDAAQKLIGVDKIPLPKDGVWDEAARAKLGIPKDPTGYQIDRSKFQLPEGMPWDENFEKAALPIAHKLGLTPAQMSGLMEFYAGYAGEGFKQNQASTAAAMNASAQALKQEWGAAYDQKLSLASRAAKHFGGDDLIKALNDSGFGNNPHLIRALAKVGANLGEGGLTTGGSGGFAMTPQEALKEANRIMGDRSGPYWAKDHPEHNETVKRVNALFEMSNAGS